MEYLKRISYFRSICLNSSRTSLRKASMFQTTMRIYLLDLNQYLILFQLFIQQILPYESQKNKIILSQTMLTLLSFKLNEIKFMYSGRLLWLYQFVQQVHDYGIVYHRKLILHFYCKYPYNFKSLRTMKAFAKVKLKSPKKIVNTNKTVIQIIYRPEIQIIAEALIQPAPKILTNHVIERKSQIIDKHIIQKPIIKLLNSQKQQNKKLDPQNKSSNSHSFSVNLQSQQQQMSETNAQTLSFSNLIPQQKRIDPYQEENKNISTFQEKRKRKIFSSQSKIINKKQKSKSFMKPEQKISQRKQLKEQNRVLQNYQNLVQFRETKKDKEQQRQVQQQKQINLQSQQTLNNNIVYESSVQTYLANPNFLPQHQEKNINKSIFQDIQITVGCFDFICGDEITEAIQRKSHRKIFENKINYITKKKLIFQSSKRSNLQKHRMKSDQQTCGSIVIGRKIIKLGQHQCKRKQKQQQSENKSLINSLKMKDSQQASVSLELISLQYGAPFAF